MLCRTWRNHRVNFIWLFIFLNSQLESCFHQIHVLRWFIIHAISKGKNMKVWQNLKKSTRIWFLRQQVHIKHFNWYCIECTSHVSSIVSWRPICSKILKNVVCLIWSLIANVKFKNKFTWITITFIIIILLDIKC